MAKTKSNPTSPQLDWAARLMFQGWVSLAVWMSVGLLLEGLLGYKIPSYLNDPERRELFRLAHTHGTFLGLVLIAASLSERRAAKLPRAASIALSIGSALMPLGFLLAGIWHPEGDPGPAVWIVPPSALLIIFGAVSLALEHSKKNTPPA
jgi:peptidoglycan/LPS O-acetylase OafA/YrhL